MSLKIDGKEYSTIPQMSSAMAEFIRKRTFNLQREIYCEKGCKYFKMKLGKDKTKEPEWGCTARTGNACPAAQKIISEMMTSHIDPKVAEKKARKLYKEVPTSILQEIHEVAEDVRTKTFARHQWNCRGCEFLIEEEDGVKCGAPAPTWCPRAESLLNELIRRARGVYQEVGGPDG